MCVCVCFRVTRWSENNDVRISQRKNVIMKRSTIYFAKCRSDLIEMFLGHISSAAQSANIQCKNVLSSRELHTVRQDNISNIFQKRCTDRVIPDLVVAYLCSSALVTFERIVIGVSDAVVIIIFESNTTYVMSGEQV